jgi:hypothetical protein
MEATAPTAVLAQSSKRGHGDGRPFPKGVSGNPHGSGSVRTRAAELYAEMAVDFGTLTAVDRVLLRRASLLLARSERIRSARDADVSLRMSSEARRTLMTLRRHHAAAPRDEPVLSQVLAARYGTGRPVDEPEPDTASYPAGENAPTYEPAEVTEAPSGGDGAPS